MSRATDRSSRELAVVVTPPARAGSGRVLVAAAAVVVVVVAAAADGAVVVGPAAKQSIDDAVAGDGVDDLVDVGDLDAAVPGAARIHHDGRAVEAGAEASAGGDADGDRELGAARDRA